MGELTRNQARGKILHNLIIAMNLETDMRFGQLVINMIEGNDLYNITDEDAADLIEKWMVKYDKEDDDEPIQNSN